MIRVVVLVILFAILNGSSINTAIVLAEDGTFTEASVLIYAPYSTGRSIVNNYLVSYDNNTAGIVLWGRDHPVNSKVSVVYNKNNPGIVWLGNPGGNAWELYKSNYDPKGTITALGIFVVLCAIEKLYIF